MYTSRFFFIFFIASYLLWQIFRFIYRTNSFAKRLIYFSLRLSDERKLRAGKLGNANPSLLNSPCNPAETAVSFRVGKVNKCRGGTTVKFEACSEFRVGARHELFDGFDASEYTANRFSNFCLCVYMYIYVLVTANRTNQIPISCRTSIRHNKFIDKYRCVHTYLLIIYYKQLNTYITLYFNILLNYQIIFLLRNI